MAEKNPVRATVAGKPLTCLVCGHDVFRQRKVKLNSGTKEFLNLAWADESASGLICRTCGHVHLFAGDTVELREA